MSEQKSNLNPINTTALAAGALAAAAFLSPHATHPNTAPVDTTTAVSPEATSPDAAWPPQITAPQPQLPKPTDAHLPAHTQPVTHHERQVVQPAEKPQPTKPESHRPTHPVKPPELPRPVRPPKPTHPTSPEGSAPFALHPENWTVPEAASQYMSDNVAYLPGLGCSGALIRNQENQPIGVLTAEHCSLRGNGEDSTQRIVNNDGDTYIVRPAGTAVQVGATSTSLQTVGTVSEFLLPANDDETHDVALGAFAGHTTDEVLSAYNANRLSEDELPQLKIGDTAYLGGWPVYQPDSKHGFERQEFPMAVLGTGTTTTTLGETIPVVWTAVASDKDGAMCSFGDSGGEGFVMQDGQPRAIGTLSAFYDLTGATYGTPEGAKQWRTELEQQFNVDLTGISAVCGFSYETPDEGETPVVAHVVADPSEIPDYVDTTSPEAQTALARQEFFDSSYQRTIIDGVVGLDDDGDTAWVDRATVFYNPNTTNAVVAWYDPTQPDNLALEYLDSLSELTFYNVPAETGIPAILTSTGAVSADGPTNGKMTAGFMDSNGLEFGQSLNEGLEPDYTNSYGINYNPDNGQFWVYDSNNVGKGGGK